MIKICICGKEFESISKWGDERKYCSRNCANKNRTVSEETKIKLRQCNIGKKYPYRTRVRQELKIDIECLFCNKVFTKYAKAKKTFCSIKCWSDYIRMSKDKFEKYKLLCKFDFNVYDYPTYFDLTLIDMYGWYAASNRGNNLNGISRDHKISIIEGFINNIDPMYISHPANCELLNHTYNQKKKTKSSLTLDELILNIKIFDEQNGYYSGH